MVLSAESFRDARSCKIQPLDAARPLFAARLNKNSWPASSRPAPIHRRIHGMAANRYQRLTR